MAKGKLGQWLKEKWIDTKTGKPCGEGDSVAKSGKYCRPSVRVNASTPKTIKEMSSSLLKRKQAEKRKLNNKGKSPNRVKSLYSGGNLDLRDKEMVLGIIELINQTDHIPSKLKQAVYALGEFKKEKIHVEPNLFLKQLNLENYV